MDFSPEGTSSDRNDADGVVEDEGLVKQHREGQVCNVQYALWYHMVLKGTRELGFIEARRRGGQRKAPSYFLSRLFLLMDVSAATFAVFTELMLLLVTTRVNAGVGEEAVFLIY